MNKVRKILDPTQLKVGRYPRPHILTNKIIDRHPSYITLYSCLLLPHVHGQARWGIDATLP